MKEILKRSNLKTSIQASVYNELLKKVAAHFIVGLFLPPQDRSLPLLRRALEEGYDRFVWHVNPDPKHEEDECNAMEGFDGSIDDLIANLEHAAPIYEVTHVGCKCYVELYSSADPGLEKITVRAAKETPLDIYLNNPDKEIGKSSYTWSSVRDEVEEYLMRNMELTFQIARENLSSDDLRVIYPGKNLDYESAKEKWLNAVTGLVLYSVTESGIPLEEATDNDIFQWIPEHARRWFYKRWQGSDPKLEQTKSQQWYFERKRSPSGLGRGNE